jgi:hypothetical protein
MIERIITKCTSGQWILTVSAAWVFAWMACHGQLPSEAVTAILGVIFTAYFRRDRSETNGKTP